MTMMEGKCNWFSFGFPFLICFTVEYNDIPFRHDLIGICTVTLKQLKSPAAINTGFDVSHSFKPANGYSTSFPFSWLMKRSRRNMPRVTRIQARYWASINYAIPPTNHFPQQLFRLIAAIRHVLFNCGRTLVSRLHSRRVGNQ